MKKIIRYSIIALAASFALAACDKNEVEYLPQPDYTSNLAYILAPETSHQELVYKGTGDYIGLPFDAEAEQTINTVRLTKAAPEDMTVTFAVDAEAVEAYNKEHGTEFAPFTGVELINKTLSIKKGEYVSAEPLRMKYTDLRQMQDGKENYMLPIVISSISNQGVKKSVDRGNLMLTYHSTYKANYVNFSKETVDVPALFYTDTEEMEISNTVDLTGLLSADWAADSQISTKISINNTYIEIYNANHGTSYQAYDGASLSKTELTFSTGEGTTGALTLSLPGVEEKVKTLDDCFVIPIELTSVDGVGAEIGTTKVCYVTIVPVRFIAFEWSITDPGFRGSPITDYSNAHTYLNGVQDDNWRDYILATQEGYNFLYYGDVLVIDLGKEVNLTGVKLRYWNSDYSLWNYDIAVSTDGSEYKYFDEGQCSLSNTHYIKCGKPVKARYVKFDIWYSYWGAYGFECYLRYITLYAE